MWEAFTTLEGITVLALLIPGAVIGHVLCNRTFRAWDAAEEARDAEVTARLDALCVRLAAAAPEQEQCPIHGPSGCPGRTEANR